MSVIFNNVIIHVMYYVVYVHSQYFHRERRREKAREDSEGKSDVNEDTQGECRAIKGKSKDERTAECRRQVSEHTACVLFL